MWVVLAFISALCLGGYDISKKIALRDHRVVDVLTLSILISSVILSAPLILSRVYPEMMMETHFYVPPLDLQGHLLTLLKSCIVLSSWIFAYISLKHLPLSVVSPMQATRPMWTLIGALLIFGERLNTWQWIGIVLAIGTIMVFSFNKGHRDTRDTRDARETKYYICLALAILIGSCAGLYDKFMMRRYDHNAVQVYYTMYQAMMMGVVWMVDRLRLTEYRIQSTDRFRILPIVLISVFLVISDNVYMLALRDPDSLIAVVSTIRRGGAVIGFAYGLLFLHESDPRKKLACMVGIMAGLICLALGSI
ncbi:MAG: EamA family transporter [Paludibacteraceae bacterium]|nr:EamA family transporter [Paludibacteraceae bacterium]